MLGVLNTCKFYSSKVSSSRLLAVFGRFVGYSECLFIDELIRKEHEITLKLGKVYTHKHFRYRRLKPFPRVL